MWSLLLLLIPPPPHPSSSPPDSPLLLIVLYQVAFNSLARGNWLPSKRKPVLFVFHSLTVSDYLQTENQNNILREMFCFLSKVCQGPIFHLEDPSPLLSPLSFMSFTRIPLKQPIWKDCEVCPQPMWKSHGHCLYWNINRVDVLPLPGSRHTLSAK